MQDKQRRLRQQAQVHGCGQRSRYVWRLPGSSDQRWRKGLQRFVRMCVCVYVCVYVCPHVSELMYEACSV